MQNVKNIFIYFYKCFCKQTMTDAAVWWSCYAYIFAILTYLTTVDQRLIIFFSKSYVSLERSSVDEVKKSIKPLKK